MQEQGPTKSRSGWVLVSQKQGAQNESVSQGAGKLPAGSVTYGYMSSWQSKRTVVIYLALSCIFATNLETPVWSAPMQRLNTGLKDSGGTTNISMTPSTFWLSERT